MRVVEAIQEIYPNIQDGFTYWETKQDGSAWGNLEDGLVWDNSEFAKPSWSEIESQSIIVDLRESKKDSKAVVSSQREQLSEKTTVEHDGNNYSNSQNARIAIINYILTLPDDTTPGSYFTYPENQAVQLTKLDFLALEELIKSNEIDWRTKELAKIAQIDAATTKEELDNIILDLTHEYSN